MNIQFYLSIFIRRLPYFLVVATIVSAAAITAAMTLPPAYESRTQVLVESPRIPEELAASTVSTPPIEQLQVLRQRLLVRENMLNIARSIDVFDNINEMNADQIVNGMRARTTISIPGGRQPVPLMTITFEARSARAAAGVLNEYLTLIQQDDVEFRRGRAGETLEFFEQEVERLSEELDTQGSRILRFKQENTGALPDSLEFRMSQQTLMQERMGQIRTEILTLQASRERLVQIYERSGSFAGAPGVQLSPEQQRLAAAQAELDDALLIYSPNNPRVGVLRSRVQQLEAALEVAELRTEDSDTVQSDAQPVPFNPLELQLQEIDSRIAVLLDQQVTTEARIAELDASIERTPEVTITLNELERRHNMIQSQYSTAEERLARARTGDVIETRSRGQRISVLEQPAVPSQPTKPNRVLIAGGGVFLGILAGLGLIVMLELLNTTARRPEDLVAKFGITPFTTIPYIRTRGQTFRQRAVKGLVLLAILTGIPAAVYAVHIYYLPLDLLADRIMDKIGIRM